MATPPRLNLISRPVRNLRTSRSTKRSGLSAVDLFAAIGCAAGLTASTLFQMQVRSSTFAASDFKTLYASAWCFARGLDAYSIPNLQQVFNNNSVVQPAMWYGHAPVYPWPTLALIAPLTALPMVPAAYIAIILSGLLVTGAVAGLMYYAARHFALEAGWRVLIAVLCLSGPLLSFGMNMGNVSVAASALCILAFVLRERAEGPPERAVDWLPSVALATAVLLKPHLALWCGVGMMLLPERAARSVVVRAIAITATFTVLIGVVLAASGTLELQTLSYLKMLSAESSAGASMSAASHEALPITAQITSLQSILGFSISNSIVRNSLTGLLLVAAGALLVRRTRSVEDQRAALLAVGAWCAFGMLATYHRAHDAVVLILLVPWIIARVRNAPLTWQAWASFGLYCAMCLSVDFPILLRWLGTLPANSPIAFMFLRQAALADLLLVFVLLFSLGRQRSERQTTAMEMDAAEEVRTAA